MPTALFGFKVLEGENRDTLYKTRELFQERALPNLSNNIKCGNSLIGTDFYDEQDMTLFENEDMRRINAFDWHKEFPHIFETAANKITLSKGGKLSKAKQVDVPDNSGFDVVIGNPPYVEFKQLDKSIKNALEKFYFSTKGKYDLFIPFIEKSINLINKTGVSSFIVPSMFSKRDFGKNIRSYISSNVFISEIVYFADFQIFKNVTNYPLIFILSKEQQKKTKIKLFQNNSKLSHIEVEKYINNNNCDDNFKSYFVEVDRFKELPWDFHHNDLKRLKVKLEKLSGVKKLKDITEYISVGIQTGKDEVFFVTEKEINEYSLEEEVVLPIYRGRDIRKYYSQWSGTYVIYPYNKITNKVIPEKELQENYPFVYNYLLQNKHKLQGRSYFEKSNKIWYELWCERIFSKFGKTKIVCAEISPENRFYIDKKKYLGNTKTFHIVLKENYQSEYLYILSILNSRLMNFYHKIISVPKAGGNYEYKTQFLNFYPIRLVDMSIKKEQQTYDTLVALVGQTHETQKLYHAAKLERDKKLYKQKIDIIDNKIDKLVYALYELTDEEIEIVEESVKR